MIDYPSNSIMRKPEEPEGSGSKKVERLAGGKVIERKQPILTRIFGEPTADVGRYILWDVLIPALKETLSSAIENGTNMVLFGEPRERSSARRDRGRSYVSYTSYYKEREEHDRRPVRRSSRRYEDVILDSRQYAEEVLSNMVDLLEQYDVVTVADFLDLVGLQSEYTDNRYGWDNLSRASVARVRDGYILDLPKAAPLRD